MEGSVAACIFRVDAPVRVRPQRAPPARAREAALLVAGPAVEEGAVGVLRAPRDDVDDAVDRVRAPERAPGAADDLDALDVLQEDVLDLPVGAGEEGRVDAAPVDENEHGAGQAGRETPHADGPLVRVDARNLDAGRP